MTVAPGPPRSRRRLPCRDRRGLPPLRSGRASRRGGPAEADDPGAAEDVQRGSLREEASRPIAVHGASSNSRSLTAGAGRRRCQWAALAAFDVRQPRNGNFCAPRQLTLTEPRQPARRAKRRGWITSSAAVDMNLNVNAPPRTITFRWRTDADDAADAANNEPMCGPLIEHKSRSDGSTSWFRPGTCLSRCRR